MAIHGYVSASSPIGGEAFSHFVMLATPIAEKPCSSYVASMVGTVETLVRANVRFDFHTLQGCCHVDDARNYIIRDFLQGDCTDLFFIDADMGWLPNDVLRLLKKPGDIVAGIYCHKSDEKTYPFHPFPGQTHAGEHGLFEMPKAATGFMRIRRHVLEALYEREKAKGRLMWLDGDSIRLNRMPVARICERGFPREMGLADYAGHHDSQSGDYVLCLKARSLGFRVFTDPDMGFSHTGEKTWQGHFGNHLRLQQGVHTPLFETAVAALKAGKADAETFERLSRGYDIGSHLYSLRADALAELWRMARAATAPVLEMGSGLSTLVLGLALEGTGQRVHSIEDHLDSWRKTARMLAGFGIRNVDLQYAPLEPVGPTDDEVAYAEVEIPETFGLALVDGPYHSPRRYTALRELLPRLGGATLLIDDSDLSWPTLDMLQKAGWGCEVREGGTRRYVVAVPNARDKFAPLMPDGGCDMGPKLFEAAE